MLSIARPEEAFARTITEWGFLDAGDGRVWEGRVAGPDRLRFLGMLSRYAGLVNGINMEEEGEGADARVTRLA
jgi:ABC-2 type transport system ATP-binding protein